MNVGDIIEVEDYDFLTGVVMKKKYIVTFVYDDGNYILAPYVEE